MKKFILVLLTTSILMPAFGLAGTTARIAAWNVASGRSDTGGTPIPPDRIKRLGEVIATKIKPDVIILEEVWPVSASAEIAKAATDAGFELEAVEAPTQAPEVVQLVTILKRPKVQVSDVELIDKSNDLVDGDDPEENTTRKTILAKVKIDNFDFYLAGVHLKSKKPSKTLSTTPLEMRDRQCKVLADRFHELTKDKEKDVLLVGDFNMTPAGQEDNGEVSDAKNFETLDTYHELRFISSESKAKTHVGFFKGKIRVSKLDGFAIAHASEKEYILDSFSVLNEKKLGVEWKQFSDRRSTDFLSDHFPIAADFNTSEDDD